MGLFHKKKNTVEKENVKKDVVKKTADKIIKKPVAKKIAVKKATKTQSVTTINQNIDLSRVIIRPRITEKGAIVAEEANAYTFDVDVRATKPQIKAAIHQIYKVNPAKVCVVQIPNKKVRVRGQRKKSGIRSRGKKAFVYLKKGDSIEFV